MSDPQFSLLERPTPGSVTAMTRDPDSFLDAKKNKHATRRPKACITCKIRRVKCTYERPSCHRCLSTGRKCDGYPALKLPQESPAPAALLMVVGRSMPSQSDHAASTAFQFFIEVCAPALLNYGSRTFWNELLLQASFVDQSIKHLTIAASRLGSYNLLKSSQAPPDRDGVFLLHYGKGLALLSQTRNPNPTFVLMACLLLILCDEYLDNPFAALQHLIAGRRILAAYNPPQCISQRDTTIDQLGPIFAGIELQTEELHSQLKPISENWAFHTRRSNWLAGDIQHFTHPAVAEGHWKEINEAAESLKSITFECITLRLNEPPPPTRFHSVPTLTERLSEWLYQYTILETSAERDPFSASTTSLYLLRIYHNCVYVLSRCQPFKKEVAFDSYASNIEYLIIACGFLISNSKPRLLPILFFVATRYRDASFRRRAICMLKQCAVDGQILAKIAMKVVRIEEKNVHDPIVCSDIPEGRRIRLVDMLFDANLATYVLRFKREPYGDDTLMESTSLSAAALPWNTKPEKPVYASELLNSVMRFEFMIFWNQDDPAFTMPAGFGPS